MTIFLFSHGPTWLHGLPEWHPSWPRFHKAPRVSHWPHQAPDPHLPLGGLQLAVLHGGLVLCNVVWSSLHILMAVPLRKARRGAARRVTNSNAADAAAQGANAAVLSFLREIIGFFALAALAVTLDRGQRPPLTRQLVGCAALPRFWARNVLRNVRGSTQAHRSVLYLLARVSLTAGCSRWLARYQRSSASPSSRRCSTPALM